MPKGKSYPMKKGPTKVKKTKIKDLHDAKRLPTAATKQKKPKKV